MPVPINVKKLCLLSGLLTVAILTYLVNEYETIVRWQAEALAAWNAWQISEWPAWAVENPLTVLWGIGGVKEAVAGTLTSWAMAGTVEYVKRRKR